jgi:hypothetical protein
MEIQLISKLHSFYFYNISIVYLLYICYVKLLKKIQVEQSLEKQVSEYHCAVKVAFSL